MDAVAARKINAHQEENSWREVHGDAYAPPEFARTFYGSVVSIGFIGIGNAGCTTLFNALSNRSEPASPFLFETRRPTTARVDIPDEVMTTLVESYGGPCVRTRLLITDGCFEACDVIFVVLRAFKGTEVTHPYGSVDPVRDLKMIHDDMLRRDRAALKQRRDAAKQRPRAGEWQAQEEEWLERVCNFDKALRMGRWTDIEKRFLAETPTLSDKPLIAVVNVDTRHYLGRVMLDDKLLRKACADIGIQEIIFCSAIFETKRKDQHYVECNPTHLPAMPRLLTAPSLVLDLITAYTCGPGMCRAWLLRQGATLLDLARGIHESIARNFVLAEVLCFQDWLDADGDESLIRKRDKVHQYAANVVLEDRQLVFFKFHL